MKKIKLELDMLAVESFATAEETAERGTVVGREWATRPQVCDRTLFTDPVCCRVFQPDEAR